MDAPGVAMGSGVELPRDPALRFRPRARRLRGLRPRAARRAGRARAALADAFRRPPARRRARPDCCARPTAPTRTSPSGSIVDYQALARTADRVSRPIPPTARSFGARRRSSSRRKSSIASCSSPSPSAPICCRTGCWNAPRRRATNSCPQPLWRNFSACSARSIVATTGSTSRPTTAACSREDSVADALDPARRPRRGSRRARRSGTIAAKCR